MVSGSVLSPLYASRCATPSVVRKRSSAVTQTMLRRALRPSRQRMVAIRLRLRAGPRSVARAVARTPDETANVTQADLSLMTYAVGGV